MVNKEKIIFLSVSIFLAVASLYKVIFNFQETISYGEISGFSNQASNKIFLYSWNEYDNLGIQNYDFLAEHIYSEFTIYGHLKHFIGPFFQKVYLIVLIILPFFSMIKLVSYYTNDLSKKIIAALMYTINPFFIERMVASNWAYLITYSLLPLILYYLFSYKKRNLNTLKLGMVASIAIEFMPHFIFIFLGILIFYGLIHLKSYSEFKIFLKKMFFVALVILILNANMYVTPLLYKRSPIEEYGRSTTFKTEKSNSLKNVIRLSVDNRKTFQELRESPIYLLGYLYITLALISIIKISLENKKRDALRDILFWITLMVLSILFSKGKNPPLTLFNQLLEIPLGGIFRDPTKLLMITSLSYVILIARLEKKVLYLLFPIFLIYNFIFFSGNFANSIVTVPHQNYFKEIDDLLIKPQRIIYTPNTYPFKYKWYPKTISPTSIKFPSSIYMFKRDLANEKNPSTETYGKRFTSYLNYKIEDKINISLFKKANVGYIIIDNHTNDNSYQVIDLNISSKILEFYKSKVFIVGGLNSLEKLFFLNPDLLNSAVEVFGLPFSNEDNGTIIFFNNDLDSLIINDEKSLNLITSNFKRKYLISDVIEKGAIPHNRKLIILDENPILINVNNVIPGTYYIMVRFYSDNSAGKIFIKVNDVPPYKINANSNSNEFFVKKIEVSLNNSNTIKFYSEGEVIIDQINLISKKNYENAKLKWINYLKNKSYSFIFDENYFDLRKKENKIKIGQLEMNCLSFFNYFNDFKKEINTNDVTGFKISDDGLITNNTKLKISNIIYQISSNKEIGELYAEMDTMWAIHPGDNASIECSTNKKSWKVLNFSKEEDFHPMVANLTGCINKNGYIKFAMSGSNGIYANVIRYIRIYGHLKNPIEKINLKELNIPLENYTIFVYNDSNHSWGTAVMNFLNFSCNCSKIIFSLNNDIFRRKINEFSFNLSFKKVSPVTYFIYLNTTKTGYLIFKSTFDKYWNLKDLRNLSNKFFHFRADYYANGYIIPPGDYELILYYEPELIYKITILLNIFGYFFIGLIIKYVDKNE